MIFVQGSLYRERIVDTLMSKVIQFRDKVSPVKTNTTCQQNLERNHDNIISQKIQPYKMCHLFPYDTIVITKQYFNPI